MQQDAPALLINSNKRDKDNKVNFKVELTIFRVFAHILLYISPCRKSFLAILAVCPWSC